MTGWRGLCLFAALLLAAGAPARAADPAPAEAPTYLRIATGPVTGTYFLVGQAIGRLLSHPLGEGPCEPGALCGVEGLTLVATASEGSLANLQLVAAGLTETALAQADLAGEAYRGAGPFKVTGALGNLRALGALYPEAIHVVVPRASPVTSVAGLKKKRVAIDALASGSNAEARAVLKAYGLKPSDLTLLDIGGRDAVEGFMQGEVDALIVVGGWPMPQIAGLNETDNIKLLPLAGKPADALLKANPALQRISIPADAYPGLEETQTLGVTALWIASTALDADLAEKLCRAFWTQDVQTRLHEAHRSAALIAPGAALSGLTLPLHEGAARCYDALGVTPARAAAPVPVPRKRPSTPP